MALEKQAGIEPAPRTAYGGKKAFLTYMLPVLVYAVLIFYLSVVPLGDAPPGEEPPDEPEPSDGGGGGGGTPSDSPAESQPAKSILYLKYNVPHFNEIVNIFLYLVLGILLFRAVKFYLPRTERFRSLDTAWDINSAVTVVTIILLTTLMYSTVIELSQLSLISRVTDVNDIILNTAGAILGAAALIGIEKYKITKSSEIHK